MSNFDRATKTPLEAGEALKCDPTHSDKLDHTPLPSEEILTSEKAQRMAEFFSLLGDANRLRILSILAAEERCVGDLAVTLGMNESAVSHQLRILRAIRLVNYRKQGRHAFYRLQDNHVLDLYHAVVDHLDEHVS
jgi:DNA-binding transcriptional ArsR family regulator